MKCLVTGASGFVGSRLIKVMAEKGGYQINAHTHSRPISFIDGVELYSSSEIDGETLWGPILDDVECVVHCAARVHVMKEGSYDPMQEFRRVNRDGTLNLARQCADFGVKRFIYLSSIGVNGIETYSDTFFTEADAPNPHNEYAVSKREAEEGLMEIAIKSNLEVVIIRPPLIYGPNAPGNFGMLLRLIQKKIPLPFSGIRNKRSFVALDNLIDFILLCLSHPMARNELFLISDGEDISTPELINHIVQATQLPNRLFYMPLSFLNLLIRLGGSKGRIQGLTGSLRVDITKAKSRLGWIPPFTFRESIHRTVSK